MQAYTLQMETTDAARQIVNKLKDGKKITLENVIPIESHIKQYYGIFKYITNEPSNEVHEHYRVILQCLTALLGSMIYDVAYASLQNNDTRCLISLIDKLQTAKTYHVSKEDDKQLRLNPLIVDFISNLKKLLQNAQIDYSNGIQAEHLDLSEVVHTFNENLLPHSSYTISKPYSELTYQYKNLLISNILNIMSNSKSLFLTRTAARVSYWSFDGDILAANVNDIDKTAIDIISSVNLNRYTLAKKLVSYLREHDDGFQFNDVV